MTTTTEKILNRLAVFEESPALIQQPILDLLSEGIDGLDIVDPTSPFMFLMGAAATMTHSSVMKGESVARKMYPKLAQNNNELFYHLSDEDMFGIYATPANSVIKVLLDFDQLLLHGVQDNDLIKHILIPRNSYFKVNGYMLGIHYPILITIFNSSNAINVRYVTDEINPLQTLSSNLVDYRTLILNNGRYLELTIPVEQFTIDTYYYTLDKTSTFSQAIAIQNQFMHARIWYLANDNWVEMATTHNTRIYDNSKPNMILSVSDKQLLLTMPDIYQNLFNITTVRVDLYTTYGELEFDLRNIPSSEYFVAWNNINEKDTAENKEKIMALQKVNTLIINSLEWIRGGSNGKSFGEIKEQVIYRDKNRVPVLPSDIIQSMADLDYLVTKYIDNVTDRVYVATKSIPSYNKNGLVRTAFASLNNLIVDINNNDNGYKYALISNGNRCTITPDALFQLRNGEMLLMTESYLNQFNDSNLNTVVQLANAYQHFYTPFFYVIDYSLSTLKSRAYIMDKPEISSQFFISNSGDVVNGNTLNLAEIFIVGTKEITIELKKDITNNYYYEIIISASIPKTVPTGSTYTCTLGNMIEVINAEPILGKQTFTFRLDTTIDIDQLNTIDINADRLPIKNLFELNYLVEIPISLDYPEGGTFGTVENIEITFGTYLEGLYIPSRTIISDIEYQKWTVNVPLTYLEDVYQRDANGRLVTTPQLDLILLHAQDDIVKDINNNTIYKYVAGEYKVDANGNFIVDNSNTVIKVSIGLFMLSANYRFATESVTVSYRDAISDTIQTYLEDEIVPRDSMLNERTDHFARA